MTIERHFTGTILVVALLAALGAAALTAWIFNRQSNTESDANALADAVVAAIGSGTPPRPLLETFVAARSIHAATVFDAAGATVVSAGTPSPAADQVFRSLPGGGSLSVEPRRTGASSRDTLLAAAGAAATAALLALAGGALARTRIRRRFAAIRGRLDEATRDQTVATRLETERGALGNVAEGVNQLLEQVQRRDLALRRRNTELEETNKELLSFTATVSHDLRAPLGSITGFAQALEDDYSPDLDDNGREYIHWIRQSATHMMTLIEGMLQMARLSRVNLQRSMVDVSAIAREIAEALQRAHPLRQVDFVIADGLVVNADEKLMHAVLDNLIGNAFKFTGKRPSARIEVGVRNEAGAQALYVRDNGAGFPPEHAAKMFRPFQRLHSEKEFSGTGIGLATVHRIVQRHGGRVWAEGEPEKGATVYFTTGSPDEEWAA
jgi:signal transduction histidine kinase